jgi:hypothetical protein
MFQEDRSRFFRNSNPNAPTNDWSFALGCRMPQSRAERKAIEKLKGIEMVSPAEARADAEVRKSLDYVQHIREGGDRNAEEFKDKPVKQEKGWLAKRIAEKGIRFGDASTDSAGWDSRPHTQEAVDQKAADLGFDLTTAKTPEPVAA